MRVTDGLMTIRDRLATNGAIPQTLTMVDTYINRAQGTDASAPSLTQLVKMLMRTPEAHKNSAVYNDLTLIEEQLGVATAAAMAEREREEARPVPKDKKFYKAQRERDEAMKNKTR
jgi:hypothetical protein